MGGSLSEEGSLLHVKRVKKGEKKLGSCMQPSLESLSPGVGKYLLLKTSLPDGR